MKTGKTCVKMPFIGAVLFVISALCGCAEQKVDLTNADTGRMIALLMPQRIEVVEAFTGFRSFDADEVPDGLEVLLQPEDSFGDPVKIAGVVRIELYAYVQASGLRQGRRICEPWEVSLLTEQDQRRYWNRVTGMYEFKLELPADAAPTEQKFVLVATYTTPLAEHMVTECVLAASASQPPASGGARPPVPAAANPPAK